MKSRRRRAGARLRALLALAAVGVLSATILPATAATNILGPGQEMVDGGYLISPNGQHALHVGYQMAINEGTVLGSAPGFVSCVEMPLVDMDQISDAGPDRNRLVMQNDGNLVQYSYGGGLDGPTFASATFGAGHRLVVQDDRNLVIYNAAGRPVWQSGTVCNELTTVDPFIGDMQSSELRAGHHMQSPDRRLRLIMQSDGNLVLYSGGRALWNTRTAGNPGAFFRAQHDGNLVVYSRTGRALWASRTVLPGSGYGHPVSLLLQSDGNLVLYGLKDDSFGTALWSTRTRV